MGQYEEVSRNMCYSLNAEPPAPPVAGGSARGEELILKTVDGTAFLAFAGHVGSVKPAKASIVILPDVRGLFHFYRDLALRFASMGIEAVAIDYFGRTAGTTPRDEDFDFWPHVQQTKPEEIAQDVATAIAYLKKNASGAARSIFTVGFCFGGTNSLAQSALNPGLLSGVISFYAGLGDRPGMPGGVMTLVDRFTCPVLSFFGGADQSIPQEKIDELDQKLGAANVQHEIVVYPGLPHSFFDRHQDQYAKENADAWTRSLQFIKQHSPTA